MDETPKGLTLPVSPQMAAKLRQEKLVKDANTRPGNKHDESSLPKIYIDLEQLIGYKPESVEEIESIRSQLLTAMWNRYDKRPEEEKQPPEKEDNDGNDISLPPPDFDAQITELLDGKVASFLSAAASSLAITYPPRLQSPTTLELVTTFALWQDICNCPTEFPDFITRLWKALRDCSRSLFWKHAMSIELKRLVNEEQTRLDYQDWNESKRQSKLENLYSIRETLVHQLDMAKEKLDDLEEQREEKVKEAMQKHHRRQKAGLRNGSDGLQAFGTTELSFPEEFQLLGLSDDPMHEEQDDWGTEEDSYNTSLDEDSTTGEDSTGESDVGDDGYDGEDDIQAGETMTSAPDIKPLDTSVHDPSDTPNIQSVKDISNEEADLTTAEAHALSTAFLKRKERREQAKRKRRQERKEAKRKARLEQLKAVEEDFRSKFTDKDTILTKTLWKALDGKVIKVDELLESLQDEEWQAEEDAENEQKPASEAANANGPSLSLLDQILAMILGAAPMEAGRTPGEHYNFVRTEHRAIIEGWEAHFGRLPPPANTFGYVPGDNEDFDPVTVRQRNLTGVSAQKQRQALGIEDNDGDDWEAITDWDDLIDGKAQQGASTEEDPSPLRPSPLAPPTKDNTIPKPVVVLKPKLVGLRPGGTASRK